MRRGRQGKRIAVLGSDLDGLIAALHLAQDGADVVLIEEGERFGGPAAAAEIATGYRAPLLLDRGRLRADLLRDLDLPAEYLAPPPEFLRSTVDGRLATCGGAPEAREWQHQVEQLAAWARRITHSPAPPLDPRLDWRRALATGAMTRLLGKRRLRRLIRIASLPIADWLSESMDDGPVAAALAAPALESLPGGPLVMGTSFHALLRRGTTGSRVARGLPAMVDWLREALDGAGAEIREGGAVEGLHSVGEGWVLHFASGEAKEVDAVVSALPPTRLFLELLRGARLPIDMLESLRSFRARGDVGIVTVAVDMAPPSHLQRAGAIYRINWESLAALEEAADERKYGRLAELPPLELTFPSLDDPRLAPDDRTVVTAHVRGCPATVEPRRLVEAVVAGLQALWPEATDRTVATRAWIPADLEHDFRLPGGHLEHGEWGLDQLLFLRPDQRCRQGTTPLDGLSICGPGCHPGVLLHGGSGWQVAKQIHT